MSGNKKKFFGDKVNSKVETLKEKVKKVEEVKPVSKSKPNRKYKTIMIQNGTDANGIPNWKSKKVLDN